MDTTKILFFSDIDGTLLRSDGTISDTLADAIRSLAEAGHVMILTSGRPLGSILTVYDYLNKTTHAQFSDSFIIANNGALIYDCKNEKPVFEKTLSLDIVDALQHAADEMHIHIQTYKQDSIVCKKGDAAEIAYYTHRIRLPLVTADRFTDVLSLPPYKMLAVSLSGREQLLPFQTYVNTHFSDSVQTIFSSDKYLELIHKDAGKGAAIGFLCDYLSVPRENSYAAGDCENDISMLAAAKWGYAMANGEGKVKSSADKVTALDCEHDGVLEIIDAIMHV